MQRGWQQQTLVQIVGTKALSHGRILCRNTLWKTCYLDTSVPKSISDRLLVPGALWHTRFSNFAPRIGAAYQVTPKTVVRGGFGLFYDLGYGNAVGNGSDSYPYFRL